ncbi:unnamed protein product [Paramecium octaurelia]|uniref:Uncharacterized protein n=1 Tax=Paramecium octaurelia TaxID=43137 RepID=A0A8S1VRM4_PAROT|nr:unnamed protein product [Paramecium octaurelia]
MQAVQEFELIMHSEHGDEQGKHDEPERYLPGQHDAQVVKHHKLSKQIHQINSDPHKFSIKCQKYKQHIKQGMSYNLNLIQKTQDSKMSKFFRVSHLNHKLSIHLDMNHIVLRLYNNLANMCHKNNYLNRLSNELHNSHMNHYHQIILDHNSMLLKYNMVSLHKQFSRIRLILNKQLDITIINNILIDNANRVLQV